MDSFIFPLIPSVTNNGAVAKDKVEEALTTPTVIPKSLEVFITREPFTDFFILHVPDGKGSWHPKEELDVDDTIEWFQARGADMPRLEKALDHVWNFYKGSFEIENYREPAVKNPRMKPNID